jgi:ribonuclease VapC
MINYGESIYIVERERGLTATQGMIAAVDQLPITVIDAERSLTFAAAHLKAHYPISYTDAFAAALAHQQQAILLTGDPEFHKIAHLLPIQWLPPN